MVNFQVNNTECSRTSQFTYLGKRNVVDLLIENGVDIDNRDNSGKTAAQRAYENGNSQSYKLVFENYKENEHHTH